MTAAPKPQLSPCNIVMKGGITSGVVYPLTIVELAKKYTFRGIGGTSAGAIAAALTAAAELGRERQGFARLEKVAGELPTRLRSLFQPSRRGRAVFDWLMAVAGRRSRWGKAAAALIQAPLRFPLTFLLGIAPALALGGFAAVEQHWGLGLAGGIPALGLGLLLAFGVRLSLVLIRVLPRQDFGFCPGIRQKPKAPPALVDWLSALLDEIAARPGALGPLTFGELQTADIEFQCFSTCVSLGRPYVLPWATDEFFFRPDEFRRLFPESVVQWMETHSEARDEAPGLRSWPNAQDLPVVVAVRMSLSFPFLFSAVPLWTRDFTRVDDTKGVPRRVLFSDGGLASNLPLQLFDKLWPKVPTFAVTLDRWSRDHHRTSEPSESRAWLPKSAGSGQRLPIAAIDSTLGFVGSLIHAMKDWNDDLQTTLPGYRERTVHLYLKDEEGGLNLNMTPELIRQLAAYGREAGEVLSTQFDWDAHRWTRTLSALDRLAGALAALDQDTIDYLRNRPQTKPYQQATKGWAGSAADALEDLRAVDLKALAPKKVPKPLPQLRLMPRP